MKFKIFVILVVCLSSCALGVRSVNGEDHEVLVRVRRQVQSLITVLQQNPALVQQLQQNPALLQTLQTQLQQQLQQQQQQQQQQQLLQPYSLVGNIPLVPTSQQEDNSCAALRKQNKLLRQMLLSVAGEDGVHLPNSGSSANPRELLLAAASNPAQVNEDFCIKP